MNKLYSKKYFTELTLFLNNLFLKSQNPLTFKDIVQQLIGEGLHIHKTSIYRKLDIMVLEGILKVNKLSKSRVWYKNNDNNALFECIACLRIISLNFNIDFQYFNSINTLESILLTGNCKNCNKV
jgi:Fe2+ or Zn2+ uptake regulation protein